MSVEEHLQESIRSGAAPGLAAVASGPDGPLQEAYAGRLGPDDERPVGPRTMFRIASMTKAMTSVAALQLIERGELSLEQPVREVLPAFGELQVLEGFDGDVPRLRPPAQPPLIRHLLTHTSGSAYWFIDERLARWHEVTGTPNPLSGRRESLLAPLVHDPGERWTYGLSTDWLGQVVEAVSGRSLEEQLGREVWEPLAMPDTTFYPSEEQRARMAELVSRQEDGSLAPSWLEDPTPAYASGGGGGHSTAHDYARFQRMLLRGGELDGERVLAPESVEQMFTDHLHGAPLPEVNPSADPRLTLEVPRLPFRQTWGLGLHVLLEDIPGMRHAGTGDWAGLFNCYFWIDRSAGVAGLLMAQVLPFFDTRMVGALVGFEAAVYQGAAAASR
jgi:methyl acetate hydrolase